MLMFAVAYIVYDFCVLTLFVIECEALLFCVLPLFCDIQVAHKVCDSFVFCPCFVI